MHPRQQRLKSTKFHYTRVTLSLFFDCVIKTETTRQIDSHMRFEPDWDENLLAMLGRCASDRPLLSTYPPGYRPPDQLERDYLFGMRAKEFDRWGTLLMIAKPMKTSEAPKQPIVGAFSSACMLFGSSEIIRDVPYDPHLYFFGEEISLTVRLWTNGWDIFHPNSLAIYHNWKREGRTTHFDDHNNWGKLNELARKRVAHLLGVGPTTDQDALIDLDRYGLGEQRSLPEYEAFSGVTFSTQNLSEAALTGTYSSAYRRAPTKKRKSKKDQTGSTQNSDFDICRP